ncbi:MAG: plastocyanin/azurin family copper-binding protein [Trueperaceae bacterium]
MRIATLVLTGMLLVLGAAIGQEGAGEGEVVEVRMVTEGSSFYFDPVGLLVEPGTTVRFINESGQHTATAYCEGNGKSNRIPEGAECWDSGMLVEEGATFEVTLTEEGVYDYFCLPHESLGMVGRIIVGSPDAFPVQDPAELVPAVQEALPSVEEIMGAEGGRVSNEPAQ